MNELKVKTKNKKTKIFARIIEVFFQKKKALRSILRWFQTFEFRKPRLVIMENKRGRMENYIETLNGVTWTAPKRNKEVMEDREVLWLKISSCCLLKSYGKGGNKKEIGSCLLILCFF